MVCNRTPPPPILRINLKTENLSQKEEIFPVFAHFS